MGNATTPIQVQFQSTLPRGERHSWLLYLQMVRQFQSTLPRGERPWLRQGSNRTYTYFNPRSREGSDRVRCSQTTGNISYFNPRSREGSDAFHDAMSLMYSISIHAPARGATPNRSLKKSRCKNFNPRSREGSDGL